MATIEYADSWTKVCNRALSRLGAESIDVITEGTDRANLCALHLGEVVGEIVEGYDWNCLTKRAELSPAASAPAYGFDHSYPLPSDFARFRRDGIECSGNEYSLEGSSILTDADEVYITYIYQPTDDPSSLPESLLNAISLALCSAIALSLTSNTNLRTEIRAEAAAARIKAVNQDSAGNYQDFGPTYRGYDYTESKR